MIHKKLGQIAYEAWAHGTQVIEWAKLPTSVQEHWEAVALAVKAEVLFMSPKWNTVTVIPSNRLEGEDNG